MITKEQCEAGALFKGAQFVVVEDCRNLGIFVDIKVGDRVELLEDMRDATRYYPKIDLRCRVLTGEAAGSTWYFDFEHLSLPEGIEWRLAQNEHKTIPR